MTDAHSITCSECRSDLAAFALDDLPGNRCALIAAHLGDCPECSSRLNECVSELSQLVHMLPPEAPPMRVERILLNRIAAQQLRREAAIIPSAASTFPRTDPAPSRRGRLAAAFAMAAMLFAVAAWTVHLNRINNTADQPAPWAELQRRVADAEASQRFSNIPQLHFASLKIPAAKSSVEGFVVQDLIAKQWHVYALHLPKLPADRAYQLWFDLGNSHFSRAGITSIDADGTVSCIINAPADHVAVRGLAISDEPATGSESPTGENLVESPLP